MRVLKLFRSTSLITASTKINYLQKAIKCCRLGANLCLEKVFDL